MKKMATIIGAVVAVGLGIAWKIFAPSAQVEVMNAAGAGWNDARSDLMGQISTTITTEYAVFALPAGVTTKISECIVDKSIEFLNKSDCSYLYNPETTTEAEHLANQEKCLEKVKFEDVQGGYTVECSKAHFPDDWAIMGKIFAGEFEASFAQNGVDAASAKTMGTCVGDKLTALMNTRKNPLVNKEAKKPEDLLFTLDTYIKDYEADKEFQDILTACGPKEEAAQ